MRRKVLITGLVALMLVPVAAFASGKEARPTTTMCVPLPISTDAKDVHVGDEHVHLPGRTEPKVCTTLDNEVSGTPTVTRYDNCGNSCFAVRVSDVRAYSDVKVEITHKEDGKEQRVVVDPEPVDLVRDIEEICISNHSAGTPDPCVLTITSPSDLKAKGGSGQVALRWTAAREAYGRSVSTTYELWRNAASNDLESFELIAEDLTETSFLDSGLERKTTYSYYVVAVDDNGNRSGGSNVATVTTN